MLSGRMIVGLVILLVAVGAIAGGIFASTAGNTVEDTRAGSGQASVSGYQVSNVHYEMDANDPTVINEVTFTADPAPSSNSTIQVRLVSSSSNWYSCTFAGASVSCQTTSPSISLSDIDELTVVAAQ